MRIGIIGAGISGLSCADALARRGHDVVLYDKGRGPGGRMSTRRIETPQGVASFDHGAQYFTVRDRTFHAQVRSWIAAEVVAPWPAAGSGAYVGVPGMNAPIRELGARHVVHWSTLVISMQRRADGWRIGLEDGVDQDFDAAVVAIPAEQAAALLVDAAPDLAARAAAAVSAPCWTVMVAFDQRVAVSRDCWTEDRDGIVGWTARNNSKPGRTGPESWVVQATPDWSRRHIDDHRDEVTAVVTSALSDRLSVALPDRLGTAAHLWRFARCAEGGAGPIFDADRRLGICGDWLVGPRVESAWLSGATLAELVE